MSEKFIIQGGKPLNGVVEISGSKNAAGPVLAASILTDEDVIIDNLPLVEDILKQALKAQREAIIKEVEEMDFYSVGNHPDWIGKELVDREDIKNKIESL